MENQYPSDIPGVPPPEPTKSPVSPIRTYRADVAAEISQNNVSTTQIALAQDKRARERARAGGQTDAPRSRTPLYVAAGIVLIVGITALGLLFAGKTDETVRENEKEDISSLIYAEKTTDIDVTGASSRTEALERIRGAFVAPPTTKNTLENARLVTKTGLVTTAIAADVFVKAFASEIPDALRRTLRPEFVYGFFNTSTNQEGYLLFRVDSYEVGFAGALSWEKTMARELAPLFSYVPEPITWKDDTLRNIEIRRGENDFGQTILLYGFIDEKTLLIARNNTVFYEIVGRFHTPKPVRQ